MSLLTTAYAGSADLKDENVDALLNQLLPDGPLGMVYIPETIVKRNQPGLYKVINWLQHNENGVGVEGTIPVGNLVAALVERNEQLKNDGEDQDELVLVIAFDPASGLDNGLVKDAHAAGIRVIDLAQAGDDIVPEDEAPAEEPAADEPVQDEPPFDVDEPEAAPEPEQPKESPAERVAKAADAGVKAAARHDVPSQLPVAPAPVAPTGLVFEVKVTVAPEHLATFAQAIVEAMGAQAHASVEAAAPLATVTDLPVGDKGTNKSDPAGQPEGTVVYYYDSQEDLYRRARGTKRKTEERVYLTEAEIEQIKAKGLHR